ncbi:MAG: Lrp/AsnC family transcriptional regulator [Firmicutes bacterium]|jgi:DNA-binding Lrp family transcriptional regulator|nr:Lrp/AsnC family transcriptional regulator [Bacillota bacterium]MCL5014878.1 Lrp/AsnC family transcriptional regulator [Bacillota bacterium]HBQ94994.1 Lrp/AsnC family transcriptional regulator [Sulfobacillus sp.]
MELDHIDRQILVIMQDNARIPLQELADRVGVSRPTMHDRVKKLVQRGYISKFHTDIDPDHMGYPVLAWVGLLTEQGESAHRTLDELREIPEIEAAYVVTGHFDILVKVRAQTNSHLQRILFEKIDRVFGFQRSETMIVLSAAVEKHGLDPSLWQNAKEDERGISKSLGHPKND